MSHDLENKGPEPLEEGIDYYVEEGRWVFTAAFHLKRGRCCGSGCRHCPYDQDKAPEDCGTSSKPSGES